MYQEDRQLVARMLAGDARPFDAFFASYARRLAAFAAAERPFRLHPSRIWYRPRSSRQLRNLERFRGEAALFTWLCEICRNEVINMQRKAARRAGA